MCSTFCDQLKPLALPTPGWSLCLTAFSLADFLLSHHNKGFVFKNTFTYFDLAVNIDRYKVTDEGWRERTREKDSFSCVSEREIVYIRVNELVCVCLCVCGE